MEPPNINLTIDDSLYKTSSSSGTYTATDTCFFLGQLNSTKTAMSLTINGEKRDVCGNNNSLSYYNCCFMIPLVKGCVFTYQNVRYIHILHVDPKATTGEYGTLTQYKEPTFSWHPDYAWTLGSINETIHCDVEGYILVQPSGSNKSVYKNGKLLAASNTGSNESFITIPVNKGDVVSYTTCRYRSYIRSTQ